MKAAARAVDYESRSRAPSVRAQLVEVGSVQVQLEVASAHRPMPPGRPTALGASGTVPRTRPGLLLGRLCNHAGQLELAAAVAASAPSRAVAAVCFRQALVVLGLASMRPMRPVSPPTVRPSPAC